MTLHPTITTIFFELYSILVESKLLQTCTVQQLGHIMAERYGGDANQWTDAYQRIRADWDSYHADLDFDGEDGLDQVYEGLYRTTRALFRLTGMLEPPREELQTLSRELPSLMSANCDVIYPEARSAMIELDQRGYRLGITTYVLGNQAHALLQAGHLGPHFKAPVLGVDNIGQYTRDELYYQRVGLRSGTSPAQCLIVDRSLMSLEAAKNAGMQTAWLVDSDHSPSASPDFVDLVLPGILAPLLTSLSQATEV